MKRLVFFIFASLLFAHDAPYSIEKFQNILNASKLQTPKSSFDALYSVKYGNFADYSNKYFTCKMANTWSFLCVAKSTEVSFV